MVCFRLLGTTAVKELNHRKETLPNNSRPLYSLAMWGLVICFTGFRKKEELVSTELHIYFAYICKI